MKKILSNNILLLLSLTLFAGCSSSNNSFTRESQLDGSTNQTSVSSSKKDSSKSEPTLTLDKNKENYAKPDYNAWNHEQLKELTKVKVSGKIVQAMYEDGGATFRIAMGNDYDQMILAFIEKDYYRETISEDDVVTFYGYAQGRYTYESTLGGEITIPFMNVVMYEDYHTADYTVKEIYNQSGIKLEQVNFDSFKVTNNSGQKIKVKVDSIDINGQVLDSYSLNGLSYEDLNNGQWKIGNFRNDDGLMVAGTTVNVFMEVIDDNYNVIATIPFSVVLEKDVLK